ncbi:hypothetical protein KIH23_09935 [Flavobacterium sp. CYK-55]|uniref:hypothetical protein n=1 Tax=Flavobacterium sp. CYK-55 TaxID=2835529 RepID=UPI001BD18E59|nr:hypothetical protein [Flavobacterium sp. CYK-55]MBS7787616.1 hypothetical protein [Flavobacterium sp. CYK-55]
MNFFQFTFVNLRLNNTMMNLKHLLVLCLLVLTSACQQTDEHELIQQQKALQARTLVLNEIKNGWHFHTPALRSDTQNMLRNWSELRQFNSEIMQTPGSSIGGFQKKAKSLSKKALELSKSIPAEFDKPEVKSRIAALTTKINQINLYLNIREIPAKKISTLVADADAAWSALYREMNEIVQKSKIPLEEGESDILMMQDPSRAIPDLATQ